MVGGSGYVVNLIVFALLITLTSAHYAVAALCAFVVAWTNNFFLNKYWTFKLGRLTIREQAVRYLLVSLVALGLNEIILYFLVQADLNKILAQALAIALVTPVSFLLTRRWALL